MQVADFTATFKHESISWHMLGSKAQKPSSTATEASLLSHTMTSQSDGKSRVGPASHQCHPEPGSQPPALGMVSMRPYSRVLFLGLWGDTIPEQTCVLYLEQTEGKTEGKRTVFLCPDFDFLTGWVCLLCTKNLSDGPELCHTAALQHKGKPEIKALFCLNHF